MSSSRAGGGSTSFHFNPAAADPEARFDIIEWYPQFQSCVRYFLDHAQYDASVQAAVDYSIPFRLAGTAARFETGNTFFFLINRLNDNTGVAPLATDGTFGDPKFQFQSNNRLLFPGFGGVSASVNFFGKTSASDVTYAPSVLYKRDPRDVLFAVTWGVALLALRGVLMSTLLLPVARRLVKRPPPEKWVQAGHQRKYYRSIDRFAEQWPAHEWVFACAQAAV